MYIPIKTIRNNPPPTPAPIKEVKDSAIRESSLNPEISSTNKEYGYYRSKIDFSTRIVLNS